MRAIMRIWRREYGDALPFALVALAVAALIVTPVLAHVGTGSRTSTAAMSNLHAQYSSDAGAEYAVWRIHDNPVPFRNLPLGSKATVVMPGAVNTRIAVVEVVLVSKPSVTPTPTHTPVPPTATASHTPGGAIETATNTPISGAPTATATQTPMPATETSTATATATPTHSPTATNTATSSSTATHTPTSTSTVTETATETSSPTATYTSTPAPTSTQETLAWAIWANSSTANSGLILGGSGHRVNGKIHSNNDLKLNGSGHVVNGMAEYVGDLTVLGSGHTFIPSTNNPVQSNVRPFPITWDIHDFDDPSIPGSYAAAAQAAGKYYYHDKDWGVSGSGVVIPEGLHFCAGKAKLSGSGLVGTNVTIVALGTIDISGSGHNFSPYVPGLTFFTTKTAGTNVFSISGSGNTGGTSYAPNGKISLTGSGGSIIGAFLGNEIDINGSGATINLATIYLPSPPTPTPTVTGTASKTATPTNSPTATQTATATPTNTRTPTPTQTAMPTPTHSPTATNTAIPTATATATAGPEAPTPTNTVAPMPTDTDVATPTPTPVPTITQRPVPPEFIYDIRSTSGGTTTVVRIRQVGDNPPEVISWYVEYK